MDDAAWSAGAEEDDVERVNGQRPRRLSGAFLAIGLAVAVVGCAPATVPSTSPSGTAGESDSARTVVAIGDSIPFNSPYDCPGCTGFVESYAEALTESTGESYAAVNRSRHDGARTDDILQEVQSGSLDEVLSDADIIIVSAGFNDQPPYDSGDCADPAINLDSVDGATQALIATTSDCIAEQTAASGSNLSGVLEGVRDVAPDAEILVLDAYNAWTGWPDFQKVGAERVNAATQTVVAALLAWRTASCDAAAAVKAECIDVLQAFNGEDATTPAGDLVAADYTHPSQKGNDLIRDLLLNR
jgi:lysophospholipase L1-like esterase